MTRFLPRILNDPSRGHFNHESDRFFSYHQATKHTYHSVRSGARHLDWSNQPDPFRRYDGAPVIALPTKPDFPSAGTFATIAALGEPKGGPLRGGLNETCDDRGQQVPLNLESISGLLWHSMAVSAWKKAPLGGGRYSLRVNPSSGNLHPTETYLALRGVEGLADGLYHYRPDIHALECRIEGPWIEKLSRALKSPWVNQSQLMIGLTSIFWREAWKYRDRAYRYCCHDMGHAIISILCAARALGMYGGAIGHFADGNLTHELGLDGSDEAPLAFLAFPTSHVFTNAVQSSKQIFRGTPNELSSTELPYELLLEMHRATILPESVEPLVLTDRFTGEKAGTVSPHNVRNPSFPKSESDERLATATRRRRSALDFEPRTAPMEREELEQLLKHATVDWEADWRGNLNRQQSDDAKTESLITLYLFLHRIHGCEPGVYRWDTGTACLIPLHHGNVERVAAFLSLEQSLAGNSCFTVSMIADMARASGAFGNRGYRYIYFEAGAIGQRLYLGAEALGWNATGIGAFYDDDVHRYLGFVEEGDLPVHASLDAAEKSTLVGLDSPASRHAKAQIRDPVQPLDSSVETKTPPATSGDTVNLPRQVVYHFAVGRAIPDPRIED